MTDAIGDRWATGDAYDAYMGRWSRQVARGFVDWLSPEPARHWLEVGCGTGALTFTICAVCKPASLVACDPSAAFVEHLRTKLTDPCASCVVAAADALPSRNGGFDVISSGLVLNFIADLDAALAAMCSRVRPGGAVAAYVWDYAGGVEFLRYFWEQAVEVDPSAKGLDESRRFGAWQAPSLAARFRSAGLAEVESTMLSIPTDFASFDDYWRPFLGGTGPAPSYVAALSQPQRELLAQRLRSRLPFSSDGSLRIHARALALRGIRR